MPKLSPNAKALAKLRRNGTKGRKGAVFVVLLEHISRTTFVGHCEGRVPDLRTALLYERTLGLTMDNWFIVGSQKELDEEAEGLAQKLKSAGASCP